MDRRNFLKASCTLCAVGMASSALLDSCTKLAPLGPQGPTVNFTLDLSQSQNAALNVSGNSLASNGVVIVNTGTAFTAIAQACTHQGCSVSYNKTANSFFCPCHGGTFDINGTVTSGPPPAALKKYTVTQNGNILTIAG